MVSRRVSGGLHDFGDEHNEYGNLTEEERERLEKAKDRANRRKLFEENPELKRQADKKEELARRAEQKGIPSYWIEEAPNRPPEPKLSIWQKIKNILRI